MRTWKRPPNSDGGRYVVAEKDFGFIAPYERGAGIFVHHPAVDTDGFRSLGENDRVESAAGRGTTGMRAGRVGAL